MSKPLLPGGGICIGGFALGQGCVLEGVFIAMTKIAVLI